MDALDLTDAEMILHLQKRGYVVRHKRDAAVSLSWHRTEPVPEGVEFEQEAVQKIAEQLTKEHIQFEPRRLGSGYSVRSAYLRIIA